MKKEDVLKQYTTPTGLRLVQAASLHIARVLNITYRTDREALVKQVPEPLKSTSRLVRFEVMNMPDTTDYGRMLSAGRPRSWAQGRSGEYIIGIVSRQPAGNCAGRRAQCVSKKLGRQSCSSIPIRWWNAGLRYAQRRPRDDGYKAQAMDLEKARQEICVPRSC